MLAQVCVPLRRKVLGRSPTQPCIDADLRSDAMVAWVLHDWRGNTFRFVVCRSSIQSAMALQLRVSNHWWQPHAEQPFGRKADDLDGRWRKQS